jgi:hypothetical protein
MTPPVMKASRWIPAVLGALRFHERDEEDLRRLAEREWPALLTTTDADYLTVPLAVRCNSLFPAEAQRQLRQTRARQALCHQKLLATYVEIIDAFQRHNVEFVVLKGIAQWPWYVDAPEDRSQSDIDFYCPPGSIKTASRCLADLGYRPAHEGAPVPADDGADHLPILIRRTGWTWQGDFYDPERPPSVELHFRFWDRATEGFTAGDADGYFARRVVRDICGVPAPTLSPGDGLTYSAMHLIRHLLRGELRKRHVYEMAHFLERSADQNEFWNEWDQAGSPQSRLVEAMAFRLSTEWFRPRSHSLVKQAIDQLPVPVSRWFDLFAWSPAAARPNKDELWLHFCLVSDAEARRKIALRRLLPSKPRVTLDAHVSTEKRSLRLVLRRRVFVWSFLAKRAVHHLRALLPVVTSGLRWWKAGASAL